MPRRPFNPRQATRLEAIRKAQKRMLPPQAVERFLTRKRDNAEDAKLWSDAELEARVAKLPVRPPIWRKLDKLQKICFLIGVLCNRFAFWNDMGTGKTLIGIALARYYGKLGVAKRVLCLVPNRTNKPEWAGEINKHSPGSSYVILRGTSAEKWQQLRGTDARFIIESYGGWVRMLCDLVTPKKGRKKKKLVPNQAKVDEFASHIGAIFSDEPTDEVSSKTSLGWRCLRRILHTTHRDMPFFPLTGTPFGRDPEPMWGMLYLVDHGWSLGETLGLFRATFYTPRDNGYSFSFDFNPNMEAELHRCQAHRTIRFVNDEGRPGVNRLMKRVTLPNAAESYYDAAVDTMVRERARGNLVACRNTFLRMRQISSGFLGFKDDETGAKAQFEFDDNPKLDMLLSCIRGVAYEYKIIVFYDFTYSGLRIKRELEALAKHADIGNVLMLYGGTRNPDEPLKRFQDAKRIDDRILILQSRFGRGPNLQIAKWGMFYESPVPALIRRQCERRYDRQYSPHKTVGLIDCITAGTADESILAMHKKGGDVFRAVVDGEFSPDLFRRLPSKPAVPKRPVLEG